MEKLIIKNYQNFHFIIIKDSLLTGMEFIIFKRSHIGKT